MATLVFQAFAEINNKLCDDGWNGWVTVPFIPIILGGLNIAIWLCIIVTTFIMYITTDTAVKQRSFWASFGNAVLYWYLAILGITIIYKLFFCVYIYCFRLQQNNQSSILRMSSNLISKVYFLLIGWTLTSLYVMYLRYIFLKIKCFGF